MGHTTKQIIGSIESEIREELQGLDIIDFALRSNAAYAAIRRDGKVEAAVIKYNKEGDSITTKVMHECEMPYYFDCPKRILNKLSPTLNQHAIEWRERCKAKASKARLKIGQKIKLDKPLRFTDGLERDIFMYVGKSRFVCQKTQTTVKISRWRDRNFDIV